MHQKMLVLIWRIAWSPYIENNFLIDGNVLVSYRVSNYVTSGIILSIVFKSATSRWYNTPVHRISFQQINFINCLQSSFMELIMFSWDFIAIASTMLCCQNNALLNCPCPHPLNSKHVSTYDTCSLQQ